MPATMTPRLFERMLEALHGAGADGSSLAELLPVTLRVESEEDLPAVAQAVAAWGAEVVSTEPRGRNLSCRLPVAKLWDLLALEGLLEVVEGPDLSSKVKRRGWWVTLGLAVAAVGLVLWWFAGLKHFRTAERVARASASVEGRLPSRATVEAVLSGDRLRLASGQVFRLAGLNAPALQHPERGDEIWGHESRSLLAELAEGKPVTLTYPKQPRDADGSLVGFAALVDGTEVNAEMIRRGAAQAEMETAGPRRRAVFNRLEAEARQARRGLWGGPVVGNLTSKVYHLPGGRFYQRVSPANRVLFATEEAARAAGYRPSAY